jgi:phenylalanyl-tRNA synthetase beta chain
VEPFINSGTSSTYPVEIKNQSGCRRYCGINIEGVTVAESPAWLKNRLRAVGLNPINNIVDITNYVQHECGQPLHAFDADMVKGKKVVVGNLPEKTKFTTLDGTERELSEKDLMICNATEGMCIAGVFGGLTSGVTQATRNIFLESAWFNPVSIRKTARRHGLNTDASFRFERGADPNISMWALKRASLLIKEIAGGKLNSAPVDVYPEKIENETVEVSYSNIKRLIGKEIPKEKIREILSLIEIEIVKENEKELLLSVPAYKVDVKKEADVIEEILRIYGYNNIEIDSHVNSTITYAEKPDREKIYNTVADMLASRGFAEIMCNSLVPAAWFENNEDFSDGNLVRLANPLSADLNVMRQSLLYGGLWSVAWNINRQNPDLKLFEFGNCYFAGKNKNAERAADTYGEKNDLSLFITGKKSTHSWNSKGDHSDFFTVKSAVEAVLSRLGIDPSSLKTEESSRKYYSDSVAFLHNGKVIAEAGRLTTATCNRFGIDQEVYYGQIEWTEAVRLLKGKQIRFRELPKYPSVRRDLALLVSKNVKFEQIRSIANRTEKHILKEVGLFDVYENESLGRDKKSYAVSFILQDEQRTLTDKSIEKVMENFVKAFEKELDAQVRK